MDRKLLSENQLTELLNKELSKYESCKACRIERVIRQEEDEDGCNWSDPWLTCSGQPTEICKLTAERIIAEARKKYNLR